jgi:hypothetical protein
MARLPPARRNAEMPACDLLGIDVPIVLRLGAP